MKLKGLLWIFALVLLISLPSAYAQTLGGKNILFIIVNALIIGIVLFLLQSFLLPNKPDKEKTAMWFVIIIASLLLAWFFGSSGYIWQTGPIGAFLSTYRWYIVLGNTVLIGAFLYFLMGWLKINEKIGTKEGTTAYGIMLFIVAFIIAIKLAGNLWIWQQGSISRIINFLFGEYGILTFKRIFIFITAAALLVMLFDYLGLGKENKRINYILAIIFAASLVSRPDNPLTWNGIKWMVRIIGTIVIGANLSEKFGGGKLKTKDGIDIGFWLGYVVAAGLMIWAISAVETITTPGGREQLAGGQQAGGHKWYYWLFVAPFKFLFTKWIFLVIFILFLYFVILKGENRRRIFALGYSGLMERVNTIIKEARFLTSDPENREPRIFKRYRLLLHALVNYTVRAEITYRYWGFVKQAKKVGTDILKTKIKHHTNQEGLRKDIIATRSGGVTEEGAHFEGWNRLNLEVVDLVNEYFHILNLTLISAKFGLKKTDEYQVEDAMLEALETRADDLKIKIGSNLKQYEERMEAYGGHHVLNAYKNIILSMTNVTGDILTHPQKFARPDAEFDMSNQTGKPTKAGKDAMGLPTDEVNQYGEVIADIDKQKESNKFGDIMDPRSYKRPRKVKPHDIINYPNFTKFITNIEHDWKGLAEDIRYGLSHPDSRTYKMYEEALNKGTYPEWADDQIPLTINGVKLSNSPSTGDEAFDMRALANPGLNVYWGRKFFDERSPSPPERTDSFHNPYPLISSLGIEKFLLHRVEIAIKNQSIVKKWLNILPADSAASEKVIVGEEVKVPIGIRLGEKTSESKER